LQEKVNSGRPLLSQSRPVNTGRFLLTVQEARSEEGLQEVRQEKVILV